MPHGILRGAVVMAVIIQRRGTANRMIERAMDVASCNGKLSHKRQQDQ